VGRPAPEVASFATKVARMSTDMGRRIGLPSAVGGGTAQPTAMSSRGGAGGCRAGDALPDREREVAESDSIAQHQRPACLAELVLESAMIDEHEREPG